MYEGNINSTIITSYNIVRQFYYLITNIFLLHMRTNASAPSTLAAFTHEFDVESPSVWRDLGKNPWELEKAKNGPSGDFMIPGELPVDAATVDVSEGFSGTIAIGQAELKDHYGLSGRCATTTQSRTNACTAVFTAAASVLRVHFASMSTFDCGHVSAQPGRDAPLRRQVLRRQLAGGRRRSAAVARRRRLLPCVHNAPAACACCFAHQCLPNSIGVCTGSDGCCAWTMLAQRSCRRQ